jgi:hypothetical protein
MASNYRINAYGSFVGIEVEDGMVVRADPHSDYGWMVGKAFVAVEDWLHWHGGEVVEA